MSTELLKLIADSLTVAEKATAKCESIRSIEQMNARNQAALLLPNSLKALEILVEALHDDKDAVLLLERCTAAFKGEPNE